MGCGPPACFLLPEWSVIQHHNGMYLHVLFWPASHPISQSLPTLSYRFVGGGGSVGFHIMSFQSLYSCQAAKFWLLVARKPNRSSDVINGKLSFTTQDALPLTEGRSGIKLSPHLSAARPVNITRFHKTPSSIRPNVVSPGLDLEIALLKSENPKWGSEGSY